MANITRIKAGSQKKKKESDKKLEKKTEAKKVEKETKAVVDAQITYNSDAQTISIIPKANLKEDTSYLIEYKGGLKTDLGIDSIYAVEMILALEEKFGIQIEMNEMDTMMSVKEVVDIVQRKLEV